MNLQAAYTDATIVATLHLLSSLDLELLDDVYQKQLTHKQNGKLTLSNFIDFHPNQDLLLVMELDILEKLIEMIKIQRQMQPLQDELFEHKISKQLQIPLQ